MDIVKSPNLALNIVPGRGVGWLESKGIIGALTSGDPNQTPPA